MLKILLGLSMGFGPWYWNHNLSFELLSEPEKKKQKNLLGLGSDGFYNI